MPVSLISDSYGSIYSPIFMLRSSIKSFDTVISEMKNTNENNFTLADPQPRQALM